MRYSKEINSKFEFILQLYYPKLNLKLSVARIFLKTIFGNKITVRSLSLAVSTLSKKNCTPRKSDTNPPRWLAHLMENSIYLRRYQLLVLISLQQYGRSKERQISRRRHKFTAPVAMRLRFRGVAWRRFGAVNVEVGRATISRLLISTGDLGQRNRKFFTPTCSYLGVAGATRGNGWTTEGTIFTGDKNSLVFASRSAPTAIITCPDIPPSRKKSRVSVILPPSSLTQS